MSSVYWRRPSATERSASCRAWATVCSASARASETSRSASARASATSCSASACALLRVCSASCVGVVDDLVAAVQDVLGVVELAGKRLADVVEQLEHVTARHDAVRGHRDAPSLLDDRDQRVE